MKLLTYLLLPVFVFLFNNSSCDKEKESEVNKEEQVENVTIEKDDMAKDENTTVEKISRKEFEIRNANDIMIANKGISRERLHQIDEMASDELRAKVEQFKKENAKNNTANIFAFEAEDNETYFMFDQGMARDLTAHVYNKNGEEVCITGGMRRGPKAQDLKPCPKEKSSIQRVIIWEQNSMSNL